MILTILDYTFQKTIIIECTDAIKGDEEYNDNMDFELYNNFSQKHQ